MPRVYSYTTAIDADVVDAFCALQREFTDQFVYYDKNLPNEESGERASSLARVMGLGRCIALASPAEADSILEGEIKQSPIYFSFQRFDAENPKPADELFQAFPRLGFLLPEVVVIEHDGKTFLQVNSLGPVYEGRVARFVKRAETALPRAHVQIPYTLELDSRADWKQMVARTLEAIRAHRVEKVVPSRRIKLTAQKAFSSKDVLVNLIDGDARGTVFLYRYGDVFFCGCTPELLVRKQGNAVESMCLAGTTSVGATEEETRKCAAALLSDEKNLREHAFVSDFVRGVFRRACYDVCMPDAPAIKQLAHVQHLWTPVAAKLMEGRSVQGLAAQLHPTPALSGEPVGESLMLLRELESHNRGFFGGTVGFVNGAGDGAFSVAIRSGVFDGSMGWLYAGCGIVEGSDAESEYNEIAAKLKTILSAFDAPE